MSLTIETYIQNNIYIEYFWDKYDNYVVFIGEKINNIVYTISKRSYATKEQAKRAFERQVLKTKQAG